MGPAGASHHDQFGPFCRELAELTGTEMVLPANSGAEAVESAVKIARKWAYQVKGVPDGAAEIRGRGLWASVQIAEGRPTGRQVSEALAERGVLCKDYHATLRVAPPLVITREEIDFGVDSIAEVLG
jgi:acetylornithine/succinyldiaminopimelate/putrescine aminotransferase